MESLELEVCEHCHGYWFDAGEIESYRLKAQKFMSPKAPNPEGFISALNTEAKNCPRCEESTLLLGSVGVTSIYKCSKCSGHFAEMQGLGALDFGDLLVAILGSIIY